MSPLSRMNAFLICFIFCFGTIQLKPLSQEEYPPSWESATNKLDDFSINNDTVLINPWNYPQRLSMYKILLNTTARYVPIKDTDNKNNILWGLPLQLGWQFRTGRLADNSRDQKNRDETHISDRSWWACMNYYLSVIPFLGAADAELFKDFPYEIEISHPTEFESDFCYNITDCHSSSSEAMKKWKTFFEFLKTPSPVSDTLKEDDLLFYMWKAHIESLGTALPRCSKRLKYLSKPEGDFGKDWSNAVDFIAATHFPTNFESTNKFQIFLPSRFLVEGDVAPGISDFSEQENRVLSMLHKINTMNTFTGGVLLRMWQTAMCSETGRAEGRNLLQNMVTDPTFLPQNIMTIIKELLKNPSCTI
ncbi:protein LEG1 homolog [Bombina bombina]|uniref:protein LEG1 homolog n=1 Tax=Bombina bombina TaxID=8345 RepID=UPI00235AC41F|nr:protein LEG1 homolog [Bombina bombina]